MRRLCVGLLLVALASATTVEPMTVEDLARASQAVVVGSAADSRAVWNAQRTMIYTITTFQVERTWKGQGARTIEVTQMGGRLDGIQTKVAGVRQFHAGERAALFLRPSVDMPGTYVITGLMQGRFTVFTRNGRQVVSNGATGVTVYDRNSRELHDFHGQETTLDQLEQRVRQAVQR